MNTEQFIQLLFKHKLDIRHGRWLEVMLVREATGFMDFGCDCWAMKPTGCCGGCADYIGHHRMFPPYYDLLAQYASLFDPVKGFLTDKGCALPRYMRSNICVRHHCGDKAKLTREEEHILNMIDQSALITDWGHRRSLLTRYLADKMGKDAVKELDKRLYSLSKEGD